MRIMKDGMRRITNTSGETLVETLVSILVSSLALIMLATAIGTAVNVVKTSKDHMESFYNNESKMLESLSSSSGQTININTGVKLSKSDSAVKTVLLFESESGSEIALYRSVSR